MFDRRIILLDNNIVAWAGGWTFKRIWCPVKLKDAVGFNIQIFRHAREMNYLRRLLRLVRIIDIAFECHGLDFFDSTIRSTAPTLRKVQARGGVALNMKNGSAITNGSSLCRTAQLGDSYASSE